MQYKINKLTQERHDALNDVAAAYKTLAKAKENKGAS